MEILMNELQKRVIGSDRPRNRSAVDGKTEAVAYETDISHGAAVVKNSGFDVDLDSVVRSNNLQGDGAHLSGNQQTSIGDVELWDATTTVNRPEKQSNSLHAKNPNVSPDPLPLRFSQIIDVLNQPDGSVDEAFKTFV
ncbi:Hypothetical protein CINCED_3A008683 [Cinara cedri]|uniref:Uncharacterized protein n=1 Tax=Cinara cedri TaxID=506608 RepID=A0A5E4NSG0_9HEMI|nr:Hypothetical protein CINCED_3A008683 [Cinara cedri]